MILKPRIVPFCSSHRAAILGHLDCHPRHRSISQGWCTYSSTVYRRTKVLICIKSKTLHIIEGLCVLSLKQLIHARRWPSTVVASPAKLNTSLNPHSEVGTGQNVRRAIFGAYGAFRIQLSSIANGVYFATKFLEIGTSR